MAETIKPKDLNPNFLKKIEDKYGPISKDDFFSSNLDTYFKADKPEERGEGGGITHSIIRLPSFIELYNNLEDAKETAKELARNKDLRGDADYKAQAKKVIDAFNNFRTFFRNNYPDQYAMVKQSVQEISTSGAAGGYLTKYAYRKKGSPANISQYLKMGYKPVNQSAVRKKSKGFEYVDLYKD
tara:strand:+ start:550 stop:1101 length:552 start_codon:yes stop_codon:yes gene_type:complete